MRTLGIEREWFILENEQIVPRIDKLLPKVRKAAENNGSFNESFEQFGYELFAGQIEDRTRPCSSIKGLMGSLSENEGLLRKVVELMRLEIICRDYVTEEELGELVVNPFDERHQKIWATIPKERKVAASQVAAIHTHISVAKGEAVRVLNACRREMIDRLVKLGDFSQGKRIRAYRKMAKTYGDPPMFKNSAELEAYIKKCG